MSALHKFLFDGVPVRGALVLLDDAWQTLLARRANAPHHGAYPPAVQSLLGQMCAAVVLLQSSIKFDGRVVLQFAGDGLLNLAMAEANTHLGIRATAQLTPGVNSALWAQATIPLARLINVHGRGRCAITLDDRQRPEGTPPYQGVVSLVDAQGQPLPDLAAVLRHYMRQSEQLDTTLVLAADDQRAAGLLIQRLPALGEGNLSRSAEHDAMDVNEDYRRIALLAESLKPAELLTLDAPTLLHRLFWQEKCLEMPVDTAQGAPHFECSCSLERVRNMLRGLGQAEAQAALDANGIIEIGCEFCGARYRLDALDVAALFSGPATEVGTQATLH
ncbi:MAG: Hsp33 family molecular chaperone HslO [Rhodoferax sp.]